VIGAVEGGVAAETAVGAHAGHDLHQFAGIGGRQGELVHHGLLSVVLTAPVSTGATEAAFRDDLDLNLHAANFQDDVGNSARVALREDDSVCLPRRKAGRATLSYRSRGNGYDREEAVTHW